MAELYLIREVHGWAMDNILESGKAYGIPKNDVYGALYWHVLGVVRRFREKVFSLHVSFEIYQWDAEFLNEVVAMDGSYLYEYGLDRIDLSNISDNGWK